MFDKIGRFSVRFRIPIVVFWLAAAAVVTFVSPNLSEVSFSDQTGYLDSDSPSIVGMVKLDRYFPGEVSSNSAVLVIQITQGTIKDTAVREYISALAGWIRSDLDQKVIGRILSPVDPRLAGKLVSADGKVAVIIAGMKGSYEDKAVVKTIEKLNQRMKEVPPGLKGYVTGAIPITNAYKESTMKSAEKTTIITVFLVIAILLMIYRSPVLPLVSLVTIGSAYGIARGLSASLAVHGMAISSLTDLFLVVLLFGAGTDYCLFIVSRFREYMADDLSSAEAAQEAIARVGETIASSAGTVIVGILALCFVSLKLFSNTGPSLAIGLLTAFFAVMTLTPALLAILGKFSFWPGKPTHAKESKAWNRLADLVTSRPWIPLFLTLIILLPFAFYGRGIQSSFDMLADLPTNNPAKEGFDIMSKAFSTGKMQPVDLLAIHPDNSRGSEGITRIDNITQLLLATSGVADVTSLTLPLGKSGDAGLTPLRVDSQLDMIAERIEKFRTNMTGGVPLKSGNGTGFQFLSGYLKDLNRSFPGLEKESNYRSVITALKNLDQMSKDSAPRLSVSIQLGEIISRVEKTGSGQDTSVMITELDTLNDYLFSLKPSVPRAADFDGYSDAVNALDILRSKLTGLNGKNSGTKMIGLIAGRSDLYDSRERLTDGLIRLKKNVDAKIPDALYLPPVSEGRDLLNPILAEMEKLRSSILSLSKYFSNRKDGYSNPQCLAMGKDLEDLGMLLDTYTTAGGDAARYQVFLNAEPYSDGAMDTVERINRLSLGMKIYQTGTSAILSDLRNAMKHDMILMWFLVSGGIILVLILLLRSLVAPIYLMATIILSYNATMGITRLLFETILHKNLTWFVPFFMFVMLMALGMDYNIFLMGRVKEETEGRDIREGVKIAVSRTGSIITSAGIIMAGTFAAMMSSSLLGLVQLGFAVTLGLLLDTFVIRTMLVPAIVVIVGKWNWWPGEKY